MNIKRTATDEVYVINDAELLLQINNKFTAERYNSLEIVFNQQYRNYERRISNNSNSV